MKTVSRTFAIVFVIAILYGVLNLITFVSTMSGNAQQRNISDIEAAKNFFGFESGKEYPLDMGQQVSDFQLNAWGGRHYFNISGATQQDVEVTFMNGNEAYLIRLPLEGANRAQIFIDNTKPASMKIDMQDVATDIYGKPNGEPNMSAGVNHPAIQSTCQHVFHFVWTDKCGPSGISDQLSDPNGVRAKGLQGMLEGNSNDLKDAVLTMPQSMYDQLVGHANPSTTPATPTH